MKRDNFTLESVSGKKIFAQSWQPDGKPLATVILVHGFGEHSSRYNDYISAFIKEGIAFVSFDQIGHGKSEGKRGCIDSYIQLLCDVESVINKSEELFSNTPKFLYGHSMGGNISLNYLIEKSENITGGIITSPWLKLYNEPAKATKAIASVMKSIFPNITIDSKLDTSHISTIEDEVNKYKNDNLNHSRISFRLFDAIVKNGNNAIANASKLTVPTLMVHGSEDKITLHKATLEASQSNTENTEYKEFEGMYHELHNDKVSNELSTYIIKWIKDRLN